MSQVWSAKSSTLCMNSNGHLRHSEGPIILRSGTIVATVKEIGVVYLRFKPHLNAVRVCTEFFAFLDFLACAASNSICSLI